MLGESIDWIFLGERKKAGWLLKDKEMVLDKKAVNGYLGWLPETFNFSIVLKPFWDCSRMVKTT